MVHWGTRKSLPHPTDFGGRSGVSLDIGCGNRPRNPTRAARLIGVDFGQRPSQFPADAEFLGCTIGFEALPLPDESVDVCTAYDFLEHVPRTHHENGESRFPFVEAMNSVWRVLKPGGFFVALTPAYPVESAFVDPTHVNTITRGTAMYFCGDGARMYGYEGRFSLLANTWAPPSSPLWKNLSEGISPAEWDGMLRRFRRSRLLWHEFRIWLRRPKATHLLWVFQKPTASP